MWRFRRWKRLKSSAVKWARSSWRRWRRTLPERKPCKRAISCKLRRWASLLSCKWMENREHCPFLRQKMWQKRLKLMTSSIFRRACSAAMCSARRQAVSICAWPVWSASVRSLLSLQQSDMPERTRSQSHSSATSVEGSSRKRGTATCTGIRVYAHGVYFTKQVSLAGRIRFKKEMCKMTIFLTTRKRMRKCAIQTTFLRSSIALLEIFSRQKRSSQDPSKSWNNSEDWAKFFLVSTLKRRENEAFLIMLKIKIDYYFTNLVIG